MLVGYARVSSSGQSLDVQEAQLREAGAEELFMEKKSGRSAAERPQLQEAIKFVRKGDTLLVTRLDRLARSLGDLLGIIEQLTAKGAGLRVLQQSAIDTTTPTGKLMLAVVGAVAEFENDLRRERQAEGIAKAKAEGRYKGRPRGIDPAKVLAALAQPGAKPARVANELGIARSTLYRLRDEALGKAPPG